jgi:hypothetical protein
MTSAPPTKPLMEDFVLALAARAEAVPVRRHGFALGGCGSPFRSHTVGVAFMFRVSPDFRSLGLY